MIKSIVHIFRQQARQHKIISSFHYNRNYEQGNGNQTHPLLWLEDPIRGRNEGNLFVNSANFSILFVPKDQEEVLHFQNLAFSAGLNIIERIKQNKELGINLLPTWSYITLQNYYDNNACGCRFSVDFTQLNMQNRCLIEEQFDYNKSFAESTASHNFDLSPSLTKALFDGKLPVFDLKTSKQ